MGVTRRPAGRLGLTPAKTLMALNDLLSGRLNRLDKLWQCGAGSDALEREGHLEREDEIFN